MKEETQFKLHDFRELKVKPFNWKKYNEYQTKEKKLFLELLRELLHEVDRAEDQYLSKGAKNYYNQIFPMCLKVFLKTSGRRLISDLQMCVDTGYLRKVPHFNSVLNYFRNVRLRVVLKHLIELSALPLAQLERQFAVDSSGIGMHQYDVWSSVRTRGKEHRKYRKVHIIYGVLSNVATSCIVTKGNGADSPQFEELLQRTAQNFTVEEVTADLAYSSRKNLEACEKINAIPFIPFKTNTTGRGFGIWREMYVYFKENSEEYLRHYHKRSNAETGFWMIKKKFGDVVSTKDIVAQENEILCKVLCHNISCLIRQMSLQGIRVSFSEELKRYAAQEQKL